MLVSKIEAVKIYFIISLKIVSIDKGISSWSISNLNNSMMAIEGIYSLI